MCRFKTETLWEVWHAAVIWVMDSFLCSFALSSHTVSISHKKSLDVTSHPVRDGLCSKGLLYRIPQLVQQFNFDIVRHISTNSPRFDHSSNTQTDPATVNRILQVWDMCGQTFVARDSGTRRVKAYKSVHQFHRSSNSFAALKVGILSIKKGVDSKLKTVSPSQYKSIWSAPKHNMFRVTTLPAILEEKQSIFLNCSWPQRPSSLYGVTCRWNMLKQSRSSWHKAVWRCHRLQGRSKTPLSLQNLQTINDRKQAISDHNDHIGSIRSTALLKSALTSSRRGEVEIAWAWGILKQESISRR